MNGLSTYFFAKNWTFASFLLWKLETFATWICCKLKLILKHFVYVSCLCNMLQVQGLGVQCLNIALLANSELKFYLEEIFTIQLLKVLFCKQFWTYWAGSISLATWTIWLSIVSSLSRPPSKLTVDTVAADVDFDEETVLASLFCHFYGRKFCWLQSPVCRYHRAPLSLLSLKSARSTVWCCPIKLFSSLGNDLRKAVYSNWIINNPISRRHFRSRPTIESFSWFFGKYNSNIASGQCSAPVGKMAAVFALNFACFNSPLLFLFEMPDIQLQQRTLHPKSPEERCRLMIGYLPNAAMVDQPNFWDTFFSKEAFNKCIYGQVLGG